MQTETWYFVTRNFKWQANGEHTHRDYLVGVRYPALKDNPPYCGPNPETVAWATDPEDASSWDSEWGASQAAVATRDTEAKVECRKVTVEVVECTA